MIKLLITTLLSVFCINAFSQEIQLLKNPGFEARTATFTKTGSSVLTIEASTPLVGKYSGVWDASTTGEILRTSLIAMPIGLAGKTCLASIRYLWDAGVSGHILLKANDGTTDLASYTLAPTSSGVSVVANLPFNCPTGGTVRWMLESTADAAPIKIDDLFLGGGRSSLQISQAQIVYVGYFAGTASCAWTKAGATLGAMAPIASCPGITTSEIAPGFSVDAADDDLPQLKFVGLTPGKYEVVASITPQNSTAATNATCAIWDGTNYSRAKAHTRNSDGAPSVPATITHVFTQTATSNVTFAIHCASSSGTMVLNGGSVNTLQDTSFVVRKYPLNPVEALTFDTSGQLWSGYHSTDCSWSRTNTAYGDPTADATCTFVERKNLNFGAVTSTVSGSDKLPGILFTPRISGSYFVCSKFGISNSTASISAVLVEDTTNINSSRIDNTNGALTETLCGIVSGVSGAQKKISLQWAANSAASVLLGVSSPEVNPVEWSIVSLTQQLPAPVFTELRNKISSPGIDVVQYYVKNARCHTTSSAGSPLGVQQNMLVSVGNISGGACSFTIQSGLFSGTPVCVIKASSFITASSVSLAMEYATPTTGTIYCGSGNGTCSSGPLFDLVCTGLKP